jgi:NTP pyrophosphatase (non-canonical NTP hydrolase)
MNDVETLNRLRDEVYANAKAHGFHDVGRTVGDGLMLICTEASEAFEAYREGGKPAEMRYECKHPDGDCAEDASERCPGADDRAAFLHKPVGVPSEIADIIIRCLDFAGEHGIDIGRAVRQKMEFNRTRPFKHGGKTL